ncbi:cilia- and flagella-associated protein 276-like isoform X1 [Biomphalaria glabrata]|uniref:Cilia- and flagella-associated protein 276-like isoform X1 n=1 Tax=Biomphalaria glabrata TaxID=6526 RepID=A0A2C9JH08_BIOGL|nr:cilia- and flagella-associated protein 276-like isoform X1 [Biomphalaria glabrata]KAI8782240.1 hypothetical protein BgiBS90_017636 [Biomphalaria glabrata]
MATLQSTRNPYPFPQFQNDDNFQGQREPEIICYPVPTHLAQRQLPWHRLSTHHTLSSARHEAYHFDPAAPNDDLDFVLKATYNHHEALLNNKNEVVFQPETFTDEHGRVLKNRVKPLPEKKMPLNHPLIITGQEKKENLNSVKNAIGRSHLNATRNGYTRKKEIGGFFLP